MPPHAAALASEVSTGDSSAKPVFHAKPIFDIGDALSLNVSEDYFAPPSAAKRCFVSREEADAFLTQTKP
jgi:hypothetical protein